MYISTTVAWIIPECHFRERQRKLKESLWIPLMSLMPLMPLNPLIPLIPLIPLMPQNRWQYRNSAEGMAHAGRNASSAMRSGGK